MNWKHTTDLAKVDYLAKDSGVLTLIQVGDTNEYDSKVLMRFDAEYFSQS